MRFIKLGMLFLLISSCGSSKITHNTNLEPTQYYAQNGEQLNPLEIVKDSANILILKASEFRIIPEDDQPNSEASTFVGYPEWAYRKIWGKYQWIGIQKNFDGASLEGQVVEIHPDLNFKFTHYKKLNRMAKKRYESRRKTEWQGKVDWVKGNIYLLTEFENGQRTESRFTVRINARGIKFLGTMPYHKTQHRRLGKRLRKLKEKKP